MTQAPAAGARGAGLAGAGPASPGTDGARPLSDDLLDLVVGGAGNPAAEILHTLIREGVVLSGRVWRPGPG